MPVYRTTVLYPFDELSEEAKKTAIESLRYNNVDHDWTVLYPFDELSEEAKKTAIESLRYNNVDHDWWEHIEEDARNIGIKISAFNIDHSTIKGSFEPHEIMLKNRRLEERNLSFIDSCKEIRKNHGKECETYKTAKEYLKKYCDAFVKWYSYQDLEDEPEYKRVDWFDDFENSDEAKDIVEDYTTAILEDYLIILRKEYEFLISDEAIIENIKDNERLFSCSGKNVE